MGKILNSDIHGMFLDVAQLNVDVDKIMIELDVNSNSVYYEIEQYNRGVWNYNHQTINLDQTAFQQFYTMLYTYNRLMQITKTYAVSVLRKHFVSLQKSTLYFMDGSGNTSSSVELNCLPKKLRSIVNRLQQAIVYQLDNIYDSNVIDIQGTPIDVDIIIRREDNHVVTQPLCALNVDDSKLLMLTTDFISASRNNDSRFLSLSDIVNKIMLEV